MFIKGGILYYVPLKEPLNAFDSNLIIEKKSHVENEQKQTGELLADFDPEFVNEKQFVNLINSFMMPSLLHSEIEVNDLIVHIKDNFAENQFEKRLKLQKVFNFMNIDLEEKT